VTVVPLKPAAVPLTEEDINFGPSPEDASAERFPPSWRLLDDVELLELPDPQAIIAGVLFEQTVGVIYSPPGGGKTTLCAGLAVAQATLPTWFGHRVVSPGATVYVAAEDPAGFKMRVSAAKRAARLSLTKRIGVYTFPDTIDLRDPVSVAMFGRFLKHQAQGSAVPLKTVIVDTYAASNPGASENSSEDTTTAMVHAQRWRDDLGVSVVLVHHTNAGGSRERGHSAMRGAADFMIAMTPVDDAIHVECSKQRNAVPFEKLVLKMVPLADGDGCVLRLAADVLPSTGLTEVQGKVFGILKDNFAADGATKSEWQRTCHDVPERSFYRACKVLVESGYVKAVQSHFRLTGKEPQE
jgi:hypothetical protein